MGVPTLSQSAIDNIVSSMKTAGTASAAVLPFDFRSPHKFPPELVREMTELHKGYTRVLADRIGRELRTAVSVEQVGIEQISYDDYIRSMPNPNILSILGLGPLPGHMVLEVSPQLALVLVDRLLGGTGRPVASREPTRLEMSLLDSLTAHHLEAVAETFSGVIDVTPDVASIELNPQFAHAAAPTEMVLVLTFALVAESPGPATRGLISLCYPLTVINPVREAIRRKRWSGTDEVREPTDDMAHTLGHASVELIVHTRPTPIRAGELAGIQPGDVIALDHDADTPLLVSAEGRDLLYADLGRSGDRLATRIGGWL